VRQLNADTQDLTDLRAQVKQLEANMAAGPSRGLPLPQRAAGLLAAGQPAGALEQMSAQLEAALALTSGLRPGSFGGAGMGVGARLRQQQAGPGSAGGQLRRPLVPLAAAEWQVPASAWRRGPGAGALGDQGAEQAGTSYASLVGSAARADGVAAWPPAAGDKGRAGLRIVGAGGMFVGAAAAGALWAPGGPRWVSRGCVSWGRRSLAAHGLIKLPRCC
jgi:hypothetical protein